MPKLERGVVLRSPVTGHRYRLADVIGHGGYGKAFRAVDLTSGDTVCVKYTLDQGSWHRESYFGELLRRHRRVVQLLDSFPVMPKGGRGRIRYCLALELADHGAVADYLEETGRPWPEARAKREIMALLKLLDQLHGGSATHRDITPFNIFVCRNGTLKLGDFGIARHALAGRPTKPDAFNPDYVTRGILDAEHRAWTAQDDVFQMGQLLGMLLAGEPHEKVTRRGIKELDITPELAAVLRRAIGPRSQRYADAWEMLQALRGEAEAPLPLPNLRGRVVVLAGPLSISRADAELLVLAAGGHIARRVTGRTDVVVRGRGRGGEGGRSAQILAAERLRRQGRPVHIVNEAELRRLTRA